MEDVCSELKQRAQEVSSAIQEAGQRAITAVETCVAELLQEVDDIVEGRLKVLEHQHDNLKVHLKAASNAYHFSKKHLGKRTTDGFGEVFSKFFKHLTLVFQACWPVNLSNNLVNTPSSAFTLMMTSWLRKR